MKHLILGGGIAGLVAGWELQKRGLPVEIWEASSRPGSWVQSLDWSGPQGEAGRLEKGPQGLRWTPDGAVDRLLSELGVSFWKPEAHTPSWLCKEGRIASLPRLPHQWLGTELLSPAARLRLLIEPFRSGWKGDAEESLHDFITRRLGREFADELLPVLVLGRLPADPQTLSSFAIPQVDDWDAFGGILRFAVLHGHERTVVPYGGMGALSNALADRLPGLRLGLRATGIEALPAGGWRVHGDGGATRDAECLILALPASEAGRLLEPIIPDASEPLSGFQSVSLLAVHTRHEMKADLIRGFRLTWDPKDGGPWLGAVAWRAEDPRGVPGLLQVCSYARLDPHRLEPEPHQAGEALARCFPTLGPALQIRVEHAMQALVLPLLGNQDRIRRLRDFLPVGINWIGPGCFGPGVPEIIQGITDWSKKL